MNRTPAQRMKAGARERVRAALDPVVELLARTGVHPDWISAAGLVLTACAAFLFARGEFTVASLVAVALALGLAAGLWGARAVYERWQRLLRAAGT